MFLTLIVTTYLFLFLSQDPKFVEGGKVAIFWRELEWLAAEIEPALLESHETGGCEESVPGYKFLDLDIRSNIVIKNSIFYSGLVPNAPSS